MIRRATFSDIPQLVEMMLEMQAASKYAGKVEVDKAHCRSMFMAMIQRHGGLHDGATLVNIAEHDGAVIGFMVGMLDRVYHVGTMLTANDVYLYVRPGPHARAAAELIDAYVEWASGNPKVYETKLSWTDTMPSAQRVEALYRAKGFTRCGAIFEKGAR